MERHGDSSRGDPWCGETCESVFSLPRSKFFFSFFGGEGGEGSIEKFAQPAFSSAVGGGGGGEGGRGEKKGYVFISCRCCCCYYYCYLHYMGRAEIKFSLRVYINIYLRFPSRRERISRYISSFIVSFPCLFALFNGFVYLQPNCLPKLFHSATTKFSPCFRVRTTLAVYLFTIDAYSTR